MDSAEIMEWFYETINKRLGQGIPLSELFAVVPYKDEAEFEYELLSIFKYAAGKGIVSQGNKLERDYPEIAKLAKGSKTLKIRVFFVKPERLNSNQSILQRNALILWTRKHPYPKINNKRKDPAFNLDNTDILNAWVDHNKKAAALGLPS